MKPAWFALALVALFATAPAALAQGACGPEGQAHGFRTYLPGLVVELPANDQLVVNGRVLAEINPWVEGEMPAAWSNRASTASIAVTDTHVLVVTHSVSCAGYDLSRAYVLNRRGRLVGSLDMEGARRFSFNIDSEGEITYRGDAYCTKPDAELADVQVLRTDRRTFVRQQQPRAEACAFDQEGAVKFDSMQAVAPR